MDGVGIHRHGGRAAMVNPTRRLSGEVTVADRPEAAAATVAASNRGHPRLATGSDPPVPSQPAMLPVHGRDGGTR